MAVLLAGLGAGLTLSASGVAATTALCAIWWITEPVPIPATSLVPFVSLPLFGALDHKTVAQSYGHYMILLLMGGFFLSVALESCGAHRRIALGMIRLVGGGGRRMILGFMLATAICSMWISNTATTLMLLPVAMAAVPPSSRLAAPLLLGIAYAASIGGIGTPVGTPPNAILMAVYRETTGREISFASWMAVALPVVAVFIPLAWLWITRNLPRSSALDLGSIGEPGPWRSSERRTLAVFALAAILWVTRKGFGTVVVPWTEFELPLHGWSSIAGLGGVGDSTVALAGAVALLVLPSGEGGRLLEWERAKTIPWGLLLLFGGGLALAKGFESTGLSTLLGDWLVEDVGLLRLPGWVQMATICLVVTFLTEVTSNTATTSLLMPILAAAALAAGIDPILLMLPAALSASCAFMLPVATAPNAIVYGSGLVSTGRMAREGIALNFIGAAVIVIWLQAGGP
jgi:solute carrier family 13 (sodium-dependent dicarboxylate transporter), member 2/3/5